MIVFRFPVVLFLPAFVFSQFNWQDNGIPVQKAWSQRWDPKLVESEDNSVIVVWSDVRNEDADIFAQRISSSGNPLWEEGGLLICGDLGTQSHPAVAGDSNGGAYVVWGEYTPHYGADIFIQHLTSDGIFLWEDALFVTHVDMVYSGVLRHAALKLCSDDSGGMYMALRNELPDELITLYVNNEGIQTSPENSILSTDISSASFDLVCGTDNTAIVAWRSVNGDILIKKTDALGLPVWDFSKNGIRVLWDTEDPQYIHASNGADGLTIIAWLDNQEQTDELQMQIIESDGTSRFQDALTIYSSDINLYYYEMAASPDNIYHVWRDSRTLSRDAVIVAQCADYTGNILWDSTGVIIHAFDYDSHPFSVSVNNDGFLYSLATQGPNIEWNLALQIVSPSGELTYELDGLEICGLPGQQWNTTILQTTEAYTWLAWQDRRQGSGDLYLQAILPDGELVFPDDGVPVMESDPFIEANHISAVSIDENQTLVLWENQFGPNQYGSSSSQTSIAGRLIESGSVSDLIVLYDEQNALEPQAVKTGDHLFLTFLSPVGEYGELFLLHTVLDENFLPITDPSGTMLTQLHPDRIYPDNIYLTVSDEQTVYLAYSDYVGDYDSSIDCFVHAFDTDGNPLWQGGGINVSNDESGNERVRGIIPAPQGGFMIFWERAYITNRSLWTTVRDSNGDELPGFESGPVELTANEYGFWYDHDFTALSDGLFVVWKSNGNDDFTIQGRYISFNGELFPADASIEISADYGVADPQVVAVESPGSSVATVCWGSYGYNRISCREFDLDSGELSQVVQVCGPQTGNSEDKHSPCLTLGHNDEILIAWGQNDGLGNYSEVYYQEYITLLDPPVLPLGGVPVTNTYWHQRDAIIHTTEGPENEALIIWTDLRHQNGSYDPAVYAQSRTVNPVGGPEACDINYDGNLNIIDIYDLLDMIFGYGFFHPWELEAADLNQDGILDILDLLLLVDCVMSGS